MARIWHTGWSDGHRGHVPEGLLEHRGEAQFLRRARDRVADTWVAERDGETKGFVMIAADEVDQVYVDASARGTGVAALLLHRGESEIRDAGYDQAWLAVVAGNQRARTFYAREGWRDAGPFDYMTETESGPFLVPCHRYEVDLRG